MVFNVTPVFQHSSSLWFIFQSNKVLLLKHDNRLPCDIGCAAIAPYFIRNYKLGVINNIQFQCAEVPKDLPITPDFHVLSLREALSLLIEELYSVAVKAYSIINWDRNHKFCSSCGNLTTHHSQAFERRCSSCELSFFPRISPSIIVLIKKGDQLLMARSPHFPPGVYGLIAGFVDAGESIEEAVHREVKEEVGLQIKNLTYWGSQPWPFPDSLMIGFTADYASGEIIMDAVEIEDAGWYRYDKLPGKPSMTLSIASKLIDEFVKESKNQASLST